MKKSTCNLSDELVQKEIHDRLKRAMPESLYDTWVEDFIFFRIDRKKIKAGYTGEGSLRTFRKEYKDAVLMQLCIALGMSEKLIVRKCRRKKTEER